MLFIIFFPFTTVPILFCKSKGQVTIPKNIRAAPGVETGDRVTFIVEGNSVRVVNSAVYAMMRLQEQMKGETAKAGFFTEELSQNGSTQSHREDPWIISAAEFPDQN